MKRRTQFFLQADGKVVADEMVTLRKSEVDQLVAEVNALREDKERIDWLSKQSRIDYSKGYWRSAYTRTLRAAIDAARKEAQP